MVAKSRSRSSMRASHRSNASPKHWGVWGLRTGFSWLGSRAPKMAAGVAERVFFSPQRWVSQPPERERAWLAQAKRARFLIEGVEVAAWYEGQGPTVLLVHGWSGRGGQLGALWQPLVARGFRVVTWDFPAHGLSGGKRVGVARMARVLAAVSRALADGPVHAMVTHSLGVHAALRSVALGDTAPEQMVLLAPPADFKLGLDQFHNQLDMPQSVRDALDLRLQNRYGADYPKTFSALGLASDPKVQQMQTLVVADAEDRYVPMEQSLVLADALGAQVMHTRRLGHNRMVRDPKVVAQALGFLTLPHRAYGCREDLDGLLEASLAGGEAIAEGIGRGGGAWVV